MKHVVELQYTNPAHEHVSLRRRVETVNRVVEAQSADEALNRAANQQRALGFRIQSANIVEQTEVISEGVELEEGKVAKALAVGAMSLASMGAKAHTDTTKSVAQLAKERPALAQRLHDIGASGQVPASDKRAAELQKKQDQEMPASERRAKELKKEEVEQVDEGSKRMSAAVKLQRAFDKEKTASDASRKRGEEMLDQARAEYAKKQAAKTNEEVEQVDEAQKKLKPSYWKAEWRLGTQSEVDKNNKKIFDKLAKTDPVKASAFHDNLMRMKKKDVKEEAEQVDEAKKTKKEKLKTLLYRNRSNVRKFGKGAGLTTAQKAAARRAIANEEVEQTDEAVRIVDAERGLIRKSNVKIRPWSFSASDARDRLAQAAKERRKITGEPGVKGFNKDIGYAPIKHMDTGYVRAIKKEEVEQVDEANMRFDYEAAARPKSSDVKNFLNRDKNARAGAASKKYIRRMTKLGGLGPNQTKKDTEKHMKDYFEEVEISEASKEGKSVMYGMRASMKAMDLRHGVDSDKRDSGYKMSPAVRAAQAKSDALSKVEKPVQAGTLAALKRRAMKKEEVESVDEGVISAVKNAQAKWKTAHRAVYGKDPSLKSMTVGAIAKLAGAKASTARAVGAAVGGKPVSAQQQAAAKARAGKVGMAKMRNEEKHEGDDVNANVKGKKAAEKMTKKAAEVRKAKIQGSVNKINMEPTIDLNKKAEK